jgi:hypothetical protein
MEGLDTLEPREGSVETVAETVKLATLPGESVECWTAFPPKLTVTPFG